jgi:hypothetical protein|tara:strand:+ start:98 stop:301 length:204 start_codon:yes stop_codon:yes gene_type:complete
MIEITNKLKSPIQLVVRSKKSPRAFTTLNIPGVGRGYNIRMIEDESYTQYIDRIESMGLISTKKIQE